MKIDGVDVVACGACGGHEQQPIRFVGKTYVFPLPWRIECNGCGTASAKASTVAEAVVAWNAMWRRPLGEATRRVASEMLNAFPWWPGECRFTVKLDGGNLTYAEIEAFVLECGLEIPS